jgi:hypothetical protein
MKVFAIALCLLATSSPASADCFSNNILIAGSGGQNSEVESSDPSKSFEGTAVVPGAPCIACYSWPAGFFRASGGADVNWVSMYSGFDLFQLSGPAGSQLSFTARLRISGSMSADASGLAGITNPEGKGTSASLEVHGGESVSNQIISLSLKEFPNDPFNLEVDIYAQSDSANTSGDVQAWLEFTDVPSGYTVTSCQGYDVAVPALVETWGRVRASYR